MKIDAQGTVVGLTVSTHVVNEFKKVGSKVGHQAKNAVRQEGVQTDADTSKVVMATTYATAPTLGFVSTQLLLRPGLEAAKVSLNSFMEEKGVVEKKIGSIKVGTVNGFQMEKQNILNAAQKEGIALRDDRFIDHRVATVNGGNGGTTVNINLSHPISLTEMDGMRYDGVRKEAFATGQETFSKIYAEELRKLDGSVINRGTMKFAVSGDTLNVTGFAGGATDIRESMDLMLSRYTKRVGILPIGIKGSDFGRAFAEGTNSKEITELRKTILEARKRAHKVEKLTSLVERGSNPMNFVRSGFRLITMPVQQADTVKGGRLMTAARMGVVIPQKMLVSGINLAAEITRGFLIKPKAFIVAKNLTPTGAGIKGFVKCYIMQRDYITHQGTNAFMRKELKFSRFLNKQAKEHVQSLFLNHLRKSGKVSDAAVGAFDTFFKTLNQGLPANLSKHGKLTKDAKLIKRTAVKTLIKSLEHENLLASKIMKLSRTKVGQATRIVYNKVTAPFRFIGKISEKIRDKFLQSAMGKFLSSAFAAVSEAMGYILTVCGIVIAIIIAIVILLGVAADIESYTLSRDRQYTTAFVQKKTNSRGAKIMKYAKKEHEKAVAALEAEQRQSDVADVNFPNGTKENYKEIYTMMQVASNFDIDTIFADGNDMDLEQAVAFVYSCLHKQTSAVYTWSDESGTHSARHINLTVLRDDMGCYEAFANYEGDVATGGDVPIAVPDISGECLNADWSTAYTTVKTLIAQSGATYNQKAWQTITVTDANGEKSYRVRQDCSGYVYACIRTYQHMMGLPETPEGSSSTLASSTDIPGFTKIPFSVNALQPGDIITKSNEHAEIFAGSQGGTVYAYSNGASNDMAVAGATKSVNISNYDYIWRCTGAIGNSNSIGGVAGATGGTTTSGNVTANAAKSMIETTGSHLNDISLDPKTFDEFIEYADNTMYILGFSNMADVKFNEDTGNENGYETALLATVNTAKNNGFFTNTTFTNNDTTTYEKPDILQTDKNGKHPSVTYTTNKNHIPKADNSAKVNSADYIRYLMAQHGVTFPFYGEYTDMFSILQSSQGGGNTIVKEVYITDTLSPGDVIWYLPEGEELTANTVTEYDIANYSTSNVIIQAGIGLKAVPMMYLGNGKVTAFCKDITKKSVTDYNNSQGIMREYNLSDLNKNRIVKMFHYTGYTVNPVWGHNEYFAGWTDVNVSSVLEAQNQSIWQASSDYTYTTEEGETISYKNFYSGEDYFAPDVYQTSEHDVEFKKEMLQLGLKYYDIYGVLPSTMYSHAAAASDYRTTEESLKSYNVFEKIDNGEHGLEVEKYTYDSDGKPTKTRIKYKQYANIEFAVCDFLSDYLNKGDSSAFAKTFNEQYSNYRMAKDEVRSKMKTVYNDDSSDLDAVDALAVEKKDLEDALVKKTNAAKKCNMNRACTEAEHNDLQTKHDALKKAIDNFNGWFDKAYTSSYVSSQAMFGGVSNATTERILKNANDQLSAMEKALEEQKAYLKEQAEKRRLQNEQRNLVANIENNRANVFNAKREAYGVWGYNDSIKVSQAAYNKYYEANQWLYLSYCDLKNFVAQNPSYEPGGVNSLQNLKLEIEANNKELKKIKKANKLKKAPGIQL